MRYQITQTDFHRLLEYLINEKIVSEILSGTEKRNRYAIVPEFITEISKIKDFPLSQLLVYGYSRTDSASNTVLHTKKGLNTNICVVGRACDGRAMVELDKKKQLDRENLFLITFHDIGYIPNKNMRTFLKSQGIDDSDIVNERLSSDQLILKMKDETIKEFNLGKDINIASNCSRCIEKTHNLSDFMIGTYSLSNNSEEYIITPQSTRAKNIIEKLNWKKKLIDKNKEQKYDEIAQNILNKCQDNREKDLTDFLQNNDRFDLLTTCTACGMCVKSCPVCFCKVCNLTAQVKAKTMDKITFITTRFTHVGDTCVECGKCTSNCPMNIPLDLIFQNLREKFKKQRNYEAGKNPKQKVMHLDI